MKQAVSVYMGSSEGDGTFFMDFARGLGQAFAAENIPVVYGGANVGTMGAFARGVLDGKGDITGVFPEGFGGKRSVQTMKLEIEFHGLTKIIHVKNFAERKQVMEDLSACSLALPGSIGTMDELFCYAVDNEIGLHDKICFVMNVNGYYDGLKLQFETMQNKGFLSALNSTIRFVSSPEEFFSEYYRLMKFMSYEQKYQPVGLVNPALKYGPARSVPQVRERNGLAVAGLVLSLIYLSFSWIPSVNIIFAVLWLLGLVFSVIALFRKPRALAIAALAVTVISLALAVFIMGNFLENLQYIFTRYNF